MSIFENQLTNKILQAVLRLPIQTNTSDMNNQMLKPIIVGALFGAAIFWAPFFALKVIVFFLILGVIFRVFKGRRYYGPHGWAYADKIRNMTDEEYETFKSRMNSDCSHPKNEDSNKEA